MFEALIDKTDDEIAAMFGGYEATYRMLISMTGRRSAVYLAGQAYRDHGIFIDLPELADVVEERVKQLGRAINQYDEMMADPAYKVAKKFIPKHRAHGAAELSALIA